MGGDTDNEGGVIDADDGGALFPERSVVAGCFPSVEHEPTRIMKAIVTALRGRIADILSINGSSPIGSVGTTAAKPAGCHRAME
jgi:hypothetical protein